MKMKKLLALLLALMLVLTLAACGSDEGKTDDKDDEKTSASEKEESGEEVKTEEKEEDKEEPQAPASAKLEDVIVGKWKLAMPAAVIAEAMNELLGQDAIDTSALSTVAYIGYEFNESTVRISSDMNEFSTLYTEIFTAMGITGDELTEAVASSVETIESSKEYDKLTSYTVNGNQLTFGENSASVKITDNNTLEITDESGIPLVMSRVA